MEIIKTYVEKSPPSRFVGRRYTDADRVNGGFGAKWGEWWQQDLFTPLERLDVLPFNDGNVAVMRVHEGTFEYWIGYFCPADTSVPDGYEAVDLPALTWATSYVYGREEEVYGGHEACVQAAAAQGLHYRPGDWCLERCNCPRFTTPDEQGCVILDYALEVTA